MTTTEAIDILDRAAATVACNRADQAALIEAARVIREAIATKHAEGQAP